jgi:hypothetical protein
MIGAALLRLWRSTLDVWASARQLVRRAVGFPRSLLPPFDDEGEEPIPLSWRDVELRELGLEVGRERQRQRELRRAENADTEAPCAGPADMPPLSQAPAQPPTVPVPRPAALRPRPPPALSVVPTLRPLPSGMPSRKPPRPGQK